MDYSPTGKHLPSSGWSTPPEFFLFQRQLLWFVRLWVNSPHRQGIVRVSREERTLMVSCVVGSLDCATTCSGLTCAWMRWDVVQRSSRKEDGMGNPEK
jgi:hypothetical protein